MAEQIDATAVKDSAPAAPDITADQTNAPAQAAADDDSTLLTEGLKKEAEEPKADVSDNAPEVKEAPDEPEVPEKYELNMPEGWTLDEEGLAALTPVMQELKATNEQVQAVADIYMKRLTAAREAQLEQDRATVEAWQKEIKADPEIGGTALENNLAAVSKALAKYGSPEFAAWMRDSGLGNYPPFVKTMVKMAKDLSDDSFISGGRGGNGGAKSAAEILFENSLHAKD